MSVTLDAVSPAQTTFTWDGSVARQTWTHTVGAGTNGAVYIGAIVGCPYTGCTVSVVNAGNNLTKVAQIPFVGGGTTQLIIAELLNPPPGPITLSVIYVPNPQQPAQAPVSMTAGSVSLFGVKQTVSSGVTNQGTTGTNPTTAPISSAVGDMVLALATGSVISASTGSTLFSTSSARFVDYAGAASVTPSFTSAGGIWGVGAVEVVAAPPVAVTTSVSLRWNDHKTATKTAELPWHDLQTAEVTAELAWVEHGLVELPLDVAWADRQAVDVSAELQWAVLESAAASSALTWADRAPVELTLDVAWADRQRIQAQHQLLFRVLGSAAADIELSWADRASRKISRNVEWADRQAIQAHIAVDWIDRLSITTADSVDWSDRQGVGASLALAWSDLNTAAAEAQLLWNVLSLTEVLNHVRLRWSEHALTEHGTGFRWAERATAARTASVLWNDLTEAQIAAQIRYAERQTAAAHLRIEWADEVLVFDVRTHVALLWAVRRNFTPDAVLLMAGRMVSITDTASSAAITERPTTATVGLRRSPIRVTMHRRETRI